MTKAQLGKELIKAQTRIEKLEEELEEAEAWGDQVLQLQEEVEELKRGEAQAGEIIRRIKPERGELYDLVTDWLS